MLMVLIRCPRTGQAFLPGLRPTTKVSITSLTSWSIRAAPIAGLSTLGGLMRRGLLTVCLALRHEPKPDGVFKHRSRTLARRLPIRALRVNPCSRQTGLYKP